MFNVQAVNVRTPAAVRRWANAVQANGGGFEANSLSIATNLLKVLQTRAYYPKIKYLLPMLGRGIGAARAPLIDVLGVGSATSVSFVDADFGQATGLQGNGSSKYLNSLVKPSQLGSSNNGGLGYWENNISLAGNVEPIGCYNSAATNRYTIDLRNIPIRSFRWGTPGNAPTDLVTPTNGHYYGQRASATSRALYFNGASIATNTTSDATSGASDTNIAIVGALVPAATPWPGRCAMAYLTDGTLDGAEAADFDSLLRAYLFAPTGRPAS